MRHNGYISQVAYEISENDFLISRTDVEGYIQYANQRFIEVSGFSEEELISEPHNVVRHPDMPAEVYEDMWNTLHQGLSWQGYVKNRRKNGDHYWVHAHIVPIVEEGRLQGYASMRSYAGREKSEFYEKLYRDMRESRSRYYVKRGELKRKGLLGLVPRFNLFGVPSRLVLSTAAVLGLMSLGIVSTAYWQLSLAEAMLPLAFVGACVMVGSALLVRTVSRSMYASRDAALQLAAGNLSATISESSRAPLYETFKALGLMRRSLLSMASDIRKNTDVVAPAVQEISRNNSNMTSRLEQQASAIQQTAASMEEISSTVRQSAENAQLATQAANSNLHEVDASSERTEALSQAMAELTAQADQMKDMVQTIDAIAFQTNILALNASVEAARAGDHGRGFSVVAQEVRKLSNQTAEAAKQVQSMIENTSRSVAESSEHTRLTREGTLRIREASRRVNDLMEEISAAAKEQSEGVGQIGLAITEIDNATQASVADMDSYRRVAEALYGESRALGNSVDAFRIAGHRQSAPSGHVAKGGRPTAATAAVPPLLAGRNEKAEGEWESF